MREIKFRFWNKKNKRFETGVEHFIGGDGFLEGLMDYIIPIQYTGLKDKNGKEIYEGDIIVSPKAQGIVIYEDARFTVDWKINNYKNHSINLLLSNWSCKKTLTVIGNIYENPKMLT